MNALKNKIDYALIFTVRHANPNGDPLDGNRPRTTYAGKGEVSDVCLKRKIRNRWMDEGYSVFVQSDDRRTDCFRSLKDRADACPALRDCMAAMAAAKKAKGKKTEDTPAPSREDYARLACEQWLDVRAFGQVFAFKSGKKESEDEGSDAVSIGVRGPVSIQPAFSLDTITVTSTQITKSVNLETNEADPDRKTADTMGMKHRVDYGVYVTYGSINVQMAEKTGFGTEDALALQKALRTLFCNDASSARPDGSMEVVKLVWWEHNCPSGQYSAAKVHRSLRVATDGQNVPQISVDEASIPGLRYTIFDGE
ncbi:MAG: type I-C CRISPR-associated protein Cas7/Csd2 [Eubacteriales bacterium]